MRSQHVLLERADNMEASELDGPPALQDRTEAGRPHRLDSTAK